MTTVNDFIQKFSDAIAEPLILLMFAVATLYFVWGVVKFIANAEDSSARSEGMKSMTWGAIGMFIMFAAWGILNIITSTFGI